jgi:N-acetylglucosamine kinase-like BadF-type ATPase
VTIIALDVGGTGSRATVCGDGERVVSGPGVELVDGCVSYEAALDALKEQLCIHSPVSSVAMGAAGLMARADAPNVAADLGRRWAAETIVVASDAVTSLVGAWGVTGGAVIAAGTGVVALGTDLATTWKRADGWGPWVGDRGSGAWIGAQGLDAALRRADGRRGGSSRLRDAAHRRYGTLADLPTALRRTSNPAAVLAGFVPDVVEAADADDDVARRILTEAAGHLSDAASAVLGPAVPPRVALIGGISRIDRIARAWAEAMAVAHTEAEYAVGSGSSLEGAVRLAEQAAGSVPPTSHPPFISVFTGRSSDMRSGERIACVHSSNQQTTNKERA